MSSYLRLGVNIDHVATIRNARGTRYPDPVQAAKRAESAGADGITAHLREDRRHIVDEDITRLTEALSVPLNLEMAATPDMLAIALRHRPHAVCIVPEKREERTTEGGLDVIGNPALASYIGHLNGAGCRVSLFVEPDLPQIDAAHHAGASVVELHTGGYCEAHYARDFQKRNEILRSLIEAAAFADSLGLEVHAGHGLAYETTPSIAAIPEISELNIGHFLIAESLFEGLGMAVRKMRKVMDRSRLQASA